jgi:hypothetical protein
LETTHDVDPTPALIINARCYDLLAVIARAVNPIEAEQVIRGHEAGMLFMSPPSYMEVIDEQVGD